MSNDTYKINPSRMLVIRKFCGFFATNASWCIYWNTQRFTGDVIKPVSMDLSNGNISKMCT